MLIEGRKGSGKTTVGDLLAKDHGFSEVALAGPLREVAVTVFNAVARMMGMRLSTPLTTVLCEDQATKEQSLSALVGAADPDAVGGWPAPLFLEGKLATPRWLLQWLGTDVCRTHMGDDVWVRAALDAILRSGQRRVVITDVRFHNEATALPALLEAEGFQVVRLRIINPAEAPLPADAHASEREIDTLPYDTAITNDKSEGIDALHARVRHVLSAHFGP